MQRLNKLLSQAGVASRRLADQLIAQGRVELNGHVVTELGTKADPSRDHIKVDGRRLKFDVGKDYFLMYKPRGVVSTRSDPQQRTTVIDLLSKQGIRGYYYPVGRLDYDSEGLLLLTNDGDFMEQVTHPRHELERTYEARVLGVPDTHEIDRLRKGVVIDGRRTLPAGVTLKRVLKGDRGPEALVEMIIKEGRNRQVRMMCDAIGHPVVQLVRTRIGTLTAAGLKPGHVRKVSPDEIRSLMRPAATTPMRREATTPMRREATTPMRREASRPKTGPGATRPPRAARPARPRGK